MTNRTIYCEDGLAWLQARGTLSGCSIVTSLPDVSEMSGLSLADWLAWSDAAARRVLESCPADGVTIFNQTDIKHDGVWVDKAYICQKAAEALGHSLLWHKIVCRVPPGMVTFSRPAYTHLLCFSRTLRGELSYGTADVLPDRGPVTWSRGMGLHACRLVCRYVRDHTSTRTIVDPFCGEGLLLAIANQFGLDAIGIDRSPKRCRKARAAALT
ncbi:MAG: SAM-dependent methyltransferase [Candidatus Xenobia bacterium]